MAAPGDVPHEVLTLLAEQFPNKQAAAAEIVNLETILSLPKGTEHFVSDIHGEFESFNHVLRSCSGVIKRHISEIFAPTAHESGGESGAMSQHDQDALAAAIYYPDEAVKMHVSKFGKGTPALTRWLEKTIFNMVAVAQSVASKYTRKYVERAIPNAYRTVILDLMAFPILHSGSNERWVIGRVETNQERRLRSVLHGIITTGLAKELCVALADLICQLAVYHVHVVGDIYDRGPAAHLVMEKLCDYHSVDIQWGNHDMLWMGAAAGSEVSMCTTVRIALRYSNMATLEDAYGIAMLPLAQLATHYYGGDPKAAKIFKPKRSNEKTRTEDDYILLAKMQKAIAVIQFKLEDELIRRHPEYEMDDRLMLHTLDAKRGTIAVGGKTHPLLDTFFPTIDPAHPTRLTDMERKVVDDLMASFANSRWLQKHMRRLWSHGGMYLVYNGNLLLHGAVPMTSDGRLAKCRVGDQMLSGKAYCDALDKTARGALDGQPGTKAWQDGLDMLYYLWTGPKSPLFGKARMTTFERYFVADKKTHAEPKDPYLKMRHDATAAKVVLKEFGLCPDTGIIVNGHTPVKVAKGESPIKADGRLLVIDGGFAAAYQKETGIAGYTLISNSYGFMLAEHKKFRGKTAAVEAHADNHAKTIPVAHNSKRMTVRDTDDGPRLAQKIVSLRALLHAYKHDVIREQGVAKL
eukprot:TRINITY_DN11619_c0_g1_i1.p1 TRINITY_DN11619_c0_g1~~TRINITY_DN11619_c0_g1_i1.p1  ORF type:complete len:721 (+),score=296.49 TRINITY_DN11619_c0_g1_i1:96-2165(+)